MTQKDLFEISCDPICGFQLRTHNEGELQNLTKQHVKSQHDKTVSSEEIRKMEKRIKA